MDEMPVRTVGVRPVIDRCGACGGLFLEFFDGEPGAIARGLQAADALHASSPSASAPHTARCPDCTLPMVRRAYLDDGPELTRCEGCLALFLTPAEASALAAHRFAPDGEEPSGFWRRVFGWVTDSPSS